MAAQEAILYQYKGKNKAGKSIQGEILGANINAVRANLRKQGISNATVKKKPKPLFGGSRPVKPADIALFSRQMATMMKAGVPLVQSFEIVAEGAEKESLRKIITDIREDVAAGGSFANALRKHPKHFDDLYCGLVEAGEESGALETMLDRIATYKEKTEALKTKIKKALTYPTAVIVVAVVVTGILLVKVVPVFAEVFQGFGADLPAFTLMVMGLSEWMQRWWLIIIGLSVAAFLAFKQARQRSPGFVEATDKLMLRIPIIGNIVYEAIIARFARTLSTTFAAGVPLIDALESVAGAAGNVVYRDAILRVKEDVSTGVQLTTALRATQKFPVLVMQLTSIGEESGALDDMLEKAAVHYEESVDNQVDNLTTLLEPMIMAVLGVLVGGLLIAMYLPIFNIGQVV